MHMSNDKQWPIVASTFFAPYPLNGPPLGVKPHGLLAMRSKINNLQRFDKISESQDLGVLQRSSLDRWRGPCSNIPWFGNKTDISWFSLRGGAQHYVAKYWTSIGK